MEMIMEEFESIIGWLVSILILSYLFIDITSKYIFAYFWNIL